MRMTLVGMRALGAVALAVGSAFAGTNAREAPVADVTEGEGASGVALPMPTGKATVTAGLQTGDAEETCIPARKGNVVTALNKRLEIDPRSGRLTLTIDNETAFTCGESYCFVDGERGLKHYGVFGKDCEKRWLSRVAAFETNGQYVTEAYLKTSAGGEYLQHRTTLTVLPDGLIRATTEGRPSQDEKIVKITNPDGFFFGGGRNVLPGSTAEFGGTAYAFDAHPTLELKIPRHDGAYPITYYANDPALRFKVTLGQKVRGSVGWGVWKKGVLFSCLGGPGEKTFFIDLRRGVRRASNPNVRGGLDWQAIENLEMPERRKNLFENGSFERGWRGWDTGLFGMGGVTPERWNTEYFALDGTVAHSGRRALRCFAPVCGPNGAHHFGQASIATSLCPVPEPGRYTVSFWAKAASPDVLACAMCPAFSYEVGRSSLNRWESKSKEMGGRFRLATAWTRHAFSFDIPKADPFKLSLVFWTTKGEKGASAWIDDVQFEKNGEATPYEPPAAEAELVMSDPDQFCELGKPLAARLNVFSAEPGAVTVSVKSFLGEPIFEKTYAFAPAGGVAEVALPELDAALPGPGVFKMKRTFRLASGKTAFEHDRFTVARSLDNVPRKWRFLQSNYGEPFENEAVARELKRWRRIGIDRLYGPRSGLNPTVRAFVASNGLDCGAYRIASSSPSERVPDPKDPKRTVRRRLKGAAVWSADYDLAHPERNYSLTNTPGVNVFLLSHLELGVPMDAAYLKRVEEAAFAKVSRYPFVTHWECSSEINCALGYEAWSADNDWDRQMRNFSKWLAAVYRGAKRANPKAIVSNDSPMNMSPSCIEEIKATLKYCAEEGVRFDAIGAHTYRYSPESPDLDEGFRTLSEAADRLGYPKDVPFECGEGMHWGPYEVRAWGLQSSNWGGCPARWWDPPSALSYDIGRTEIRAAAWRARSWLVCYKYAKRMNEMNSGNTNDFELDANGTPFLSQIISSVLVNLLGSADFVEDVRFAPYCRAYVFTDERGRGIAALWNHKGTVDEGREDAPVATADFGETLETVRDMVGSRRAFAGSGTFAVTPQPLFFISKPGRTADLVAAVKGLRVASGSGLNRGEVAFRPIAPDATAVTVCDYAGKASNRVEKITPPLVAGAVRTVRVPSLEASYPAFLAPHVDEKATAATIDWSKVPVQRLANRCGRPGASFAAAQQLAWNRAALYLRVTVTDPTFVHVGTLHPAQRYDNDCLQVFLDAGANARYSHRRGFDDDDYSYDVLPEANGKSAKVYRRRTPDMQLTLGVFAPKDGTLADELPVAFDRTPDGYVYTLTLPAKYVLPLRLEKGRAVGFGLYVSDANDAKKPQGSRSEGALTNSSEPGRGAYDHPERWPVALLWD